MNLMTRILKPIKNLSWRFEEWTLAELQDCGFGESSLFEHKKDQLEEKIF